MDNFSDFNDDFDDRIEIDNSWFFGCNRCLICNHHYRHSRALKIENADHGIYVVKDRFAHSSCSKILKDIKRKKEELLELEDKQFLMKSGLRPNPI